jgi:hypothetical protein
VCSEIESATSVEHCFLFNKYSQVLLCERDGSSVLIELRPDDTMSSLIARKQPLIINDVQRERVFLNMLREKLNIKIYNALVVPIVCSYKSQVD